MDTNEQDLATKLIAGWRLNNAAVIETIKAEISKAINEKGIRPVSETIDLLVRYVPKFPLSYLRKSLQCVKPDQVPEEEVPNNFLSLDEIGDERTDKWLIDGKLTTQEEGEATPNESFLDIGGWQEPMSDEEWHIMCTVDGDAWFWRRNPKYKDNTFISVYREAKKEGVSMHDICRKKGLIYRLLFRGKQI